MGVEENQVSGAREQHLRNRENKVREVGGGGKGGGGRQRGRREEEEKEKEMRERTKRGEEREGKESSGAQSTCSKRDLALVLCSVSCNVTLARIV